MTRDEIISTILSRLGQRQTDTALQEAAVKELATVQRKLEDDKFKPWFLLSEMLTTTTAVGEPRITLPDTFLAECDEGSFWRYDAAASTTYTELRKMEQDTMLQRYPTAGIPLAYAVVGGYAHLAPVPDAAYTLKSQFYLRQAVLTTAYGVGDGPTFENNWMLHASAWLMAELGEVLAKYYVRDTEAAALFHGDAQLARSTCYTDTVARQEANALRSMGDD